MEELNLPSLDSYKYKPLRTQVYEVLREAILQGRLKPGDKITEVAVAGELNVSRTPVREAIRMLELEEFLVIVPQRGIFVAGIKSVKEIDEIFRVRACLEEMAARIAARKISEETMVKLDYYCRQIDKCLQEKDLEKCMEIDNALHKLIYEVADNRWLQKWLETLFEKVTRYRPESLSREDRFVAALEEHKMILEAIISGEANKAGKLSRQHVEKAGESVKKAYNSYQVEE
ncbi:MAG: GntR family transcriptional regulator [Halanaerobiales bacterium]